jgi:hypothetical protein
MVQTKRRPRGASPASGLRVLDAQAPQLPPKDAPVTARNWGVPAGPALTSMFPRAASGRRPGSRARRHRRRRVMARRCQTPPAQASGRSPVQQIKPCAPTPVRPARSPGNQGAPRGGTAAFTLLHEKLGAKAGTPTFQHKRSRLDGRTHPLLARRQRRPKTQAAQELLLPRCGKLAARRPATKQEFTTSRLGVAVQHREERPRGRREEGAAVLTMGRRCSRGRPAGDVASVSR